MEHILDAIERIETYVAGIDQKAFERSSLIQDAVIINLEVVGEVANNILSTDPDFAQRHPHLHLDLAYRMRNALIHEYDTVNLSTIWNTIQSDLMILKRHMVDISTR